VTKGIRLGVKNEPKPSQPEKGLRLEEVVPVGKD